MIEIEGLAHLLSLTKSSDHVTVVDFYADWCGPCKVAAPLYEKMSSYYDAKDVVFTKCNVDRQKDASAHFLISAMPTFLVCHAGEVLYKVQGADMGLLQRNVDLCVNYLKSSRTTGPSAAAPSAPSTKEVTGQNAFSVVMLKIAVARKNDDVMEEKRLCSEAYEMLAVRSENWDAGVLLVPYLASNSYASDALDSLLSNIATRENNKRYDGETFVNQTLRFVVELLSNITWDNLDLVQICVRVIVSLAQSSVAQSIMAESTYFYSDFITTGEALERGTVLGALLGVGPAAKPAFSLPQQRSMSEWRLLMELFPASETDHSTKVHALKDTVETLGDIINKAVQQLLKGKNTRQITLRWFGKAVELNDGYFKTVHHDDPLSSRFFMGQLMFLLIEAALPIFKGSFDYSKIPACYLLGGEENPTVVHVDESIERIEHFDEENPLPKYNNETEPYKPLVHLFFLGARAVMFSATFIELYNTDRRQATHPQAGPRQRAAFQAEASLYKVILTPRKWASSRLQLVNYMAHWLLHVMGVGNNGVLPATVPVEWRYLPQKLVDSVIRATQMTVKDSLFVDGLVALMLMLMGNTDYFPKPHAHALFPAFLIELMQNPETRRVLESHPWFSNNIVRRCVQCYIAVEKSTYERVQVRYELSYCIKDFLQVNSLCAPVRDEFGAAGTVLEKFSHMAVGEVNESVDQLIEILKKMHEKMKAGADLSVNAVATRPAEREGEPPRPNAAENQESESDSEPEEGNETYHQLGQSLRNYIQLFNASMDMFIELAEQFQKGVSQNMVALQISQMLCRSLVCFAGPKSTTLKIEHADRYEYQPREILRRLVDCLTRFRRSKSFLSCVCQCGVPLDDILSSITTVVTRNLVTEDLTWRLTEMSEALKKVSKDVGDEEALWNDAPDFALDALLSTPLQHPVALPSEVKDLEDLVYVNKDTIHHLLLSEPKHPFTKEYLDEKMVEAFNNKPEVQEARKKLQAKIEEWMTEAKKNLGA